MDGILRDFSPVCLETDGVEGKIDFSEVFGRCLPVHIEIGSGRGSFLLSQARAEPGADFLGIEWARKYYRYSADRMQRWKMTNVKVVRADAASFIADFVGDGCAECFHIYFPDPWPKRHHHKRRFINDGNLQQLIRCLNIGGQIRIATDHSQYFLWIKAVLSAFSGVLEEVAFEPARQAGPTEQVGTNFERKYIRENRTIYTVAVEKRIQSYRLK